MLVVSDMAAAPAVSDAVVPLELQEVPMVASDVAAEPAVSDAVVLPLVLQAAPMVASDVARSPAEMAMIDVGATLAVAAVPLVVASGAVPASKEQLDEALLCEYERLLRDPAVVNAKRALSATYEGSERQMMRGLAAARARRSGRME